LCSENSGSGGVLQDSISENASFEEQDDLLVGVKSSPAFGGRLSEFEHHREAGSPGSVPFGASVAKPNRGEGAFNRIRRSKVTPVFVREKVSGLNGTAAWGARIYGDGRRTGDSPDRFGRVVLADSTAEQHASRMKGVGRFP
jgi:hypothetical protein